MDVCWPQTGWASMCSGIENSGIDEEEHVASHLSRYWDCWDISGSYRGQNPDLQRDECEIQDGKVILTDSRDTSKEAVSSQSSTLDFSVISKSSDGSNVSATDVQDLGIGKIAEQKSLLLDDYCIHEGHSNHGFHSGLQTDIELTPNGGKEIEPKRQNATFVNHRKREAEGMTSLESGSITNTKQCSPSDQSGTKLSLNASSKVAEQTVKKETQSDGSASVGAIDEFSTVLKLGKRTYSEGKAASGQNKVVAVPSSSRSSPGKKQKALSPVSNVPRCQVEGCGADLLRCKDYHRKHKVCESHSKATKVKIKDKVQRFCQQCSRFHLLEEFDEGKRSCRRRLAGHNERRRKPQPVTVPLLAGDNFIFSSDGKYSSIGHSEWPFFLDHQCASWSPPCTLDQVALACQLRGLAFADTESILTVLSHPAADQILRFLWSPEGHAAQWACHEIHPVMEQGLVYPKSLDAVHPYLDAFPASQGLMGTSDSGCALSLLSSSCVSSSTHCTMPVQTSGSFELFPSKNQVIPCQQMLPNASNGEKSYFGHVSSKLMAATSPLHPLNGSHVINLGSVDIQNKEGHGQESLSGGSMLLMPQGHEFQVMQRLGSQHGPLTVETMQISALQSEGSQFEAKQQSWKGQFSEFVGLKPYEAMLGR